MESTVLKIDFKHQGRNNPGIPLLETRDLKVFYGETEALHGITMTFEENRVHSIIGPSGCGKSTLLRAFNRMHEISGHGRTEGQITLRGEDLTNLDPIAVRKRMGMVFQRPNPFPNMSIYENVLAGCRLNGVKLSRDEADALVEYALDKAALWDEVKDKLKQRGTYLSGGQQQRLCIARALAMGPDVLLLDEPTSALDPIATSNIEALVLELRETVTIIMVTHNIQQAGRISDRVAFMYLGELVEYGHVEEMFLNPKDARTEKYIKGQFG